MKLALGLLVLAACQSPVIQHPYTPTDAANSTFRVEAQQLVDGEYTGVWSGTGWIVRNEGNFSHAITAGHVCKSDEPTQFLVRDRFGTAYPAVVEKISDKYDLCELVMERLGPELELAPMMPDYDEPVMMVGAPLGLWGCDNASDGETFDCGMAPIAHGHYGGGRLVSLQATHGNSGSAVFTPFGVFGVLVSGYPAFSNIGFVEPLDHIKEFLAD